MFIEKILSQHRNDFTATLRCEHCESTQKLGSGYHDAFYHEKVIPAIACHACGKKRDGAKGQREFANVGAQHHAGHRPGSLDGDGMSDNKETKQARHGHVTPRPDGIKARCGGPAICHICQAEQSELEAKQAPAVEANDRELDAHLIDRLSKLLAEIALILNGEPAPLTRPSYHNLPDKVRALQCEVELLRAKEAPAVEAGARDERATFEKFAKGKFNLSPLKGEGDLLYERENTDSAWKGWQARAALARASEAAAGEPVAWMHKQGDYLEPSLLPLEDEALVRGWTERPLVYGAPQPASEQQINRMTEEDVERQYLDGVHIGSGLPRETCPCGLCEKHRFGFNRVGEETAPCPLCGGHMTYEHDASEVSPYGHYFSCDHCAMTTGSSPSKEAAIAACNRRFASEQQISQIVYDWLQRAGVTAHEDRVEELIGYLLAAGEQKAAPAFDFATRLTSFGMLVRALRIVAGTTLYDMAKALLTTPANLSSMEFGRAAVTTEFAFDVAAYFDALGVGGTLDALTVAAAKGDGDADK